MAAQNGRPNFDDQDRRAIAADGKKSAVAQRDLAVEAGQEIEAEQRDRVDEHLGDLIDMIAARRRTGRRRAISPTASGDQDAATRRSPSAIGHTLATRRRPNRPDGRDTKTPMMIASATDSLTSEPTT